MSDEEGGVELTEALYTTRAMRRVLPDPVPDEAVAAMLDAAIRAPSGGNNQNWRFMTVSDLDSPPNPRAYLPAGVGPAQRHRLSGPAGGGGAGRR